MEEHSSNSQFSFPIPESHIRFTQSRIQSLLKKFDKKVPDITFLETSEVCDSVRDKILYYEDESHLSKIQNNNRRIFIASELFISICTIYGDIVDYEYTNIVSSIVQWEKYQKLSRKIMKSIHLQLKQEKYFVNEAKSKLLKDLQESKDLEKGKAITPITAEHLEWVSGLEKDTEQLPRVAEGGPEQELRLEKDRETETVTVREEGEPLEEHKEIETAAKDDFGQKETLDLVPESSSRDLVPESSSRDLVPESSSRDLVPESLSRDDLSNITGHLTEIRAESIIDTSKLPYSVSNTLEQVHSLADISADISVKELQKLQKTDGDHLAQILQILEDQVFQKEIEKPDILLETRDKDFEATNETQASELMNLVEKQTDALEGSEEWSLPSLEPVEKTRKKHSHLIIDKDTFIPDYAARALHMNRNIDIQRIQVFEGPPTILKAMSADHLMSTPGFKSSTFRDTRSSKLSALFSRNLKVEKKPVEAALLQTRMVEKQKELNISKVRRSADVIEGVETRIAMRSEFERGDVSAVLAPEKSVLENIAEEVLPTEKLIGTPLSRIISPTVERPGETQMEVINAAPILPSQRPQRLQGKSLDRSTSPPWFLSTKKDPPSSKYREFNYVYKRLQDYWSLCEDQGMEKCITIREFFSFGVDGSVANFLTVLRIVDKMSIQRKLLLEYKNRDVLIRPFEKPYVSDGQVLLKEKEVIF